MSALCPVPVSAARPVSVRTRRTKPNCHYCDCGAHAWATLSSWGVAIVSPEDAGLLEAHVWTLDHSYPFLAYAFRSTGTSTIRLHREIMNDPEGSLVDHWNANGLDNWRSNLRVTDTVGNCANQRKTRGTSRFKGVYWHRKDRVWMARIKSGGKTIYLGSFRDEVEAARVYDDAALRTFGAMARVNFPPAAA